jgi:hypothetical protein
VRRSPLFSIHGVNVHVGQNRRTKWKNSGNASSRALLAPPSPQGLPTPRPQQNTSRFGTLRRRDAGQDNFSSIPDRTGGRAATHRCRSVDDTRASCVALALRWNGVARVTWRPSGDNHTVLIVRTKGGAARKSGPTDSIAITSSEGAVADRIGTGIRQVRILSCIRSYVRRLERPISRHYGKR